MKQKADNHWIGIVGRSALVDERSDILVVYPSPWKAAAAFLGALVFVALGLAFFWFREEIGLDIVHLFIATFLGVPFFGACAVYALYRLVYRRPALVVDAGGLFDNASALGVGLLRWDEILAIMPYRYCGQWMLGVIPKDLEAVLNRQGLFKRRLLRMNGALGCAPINIPQSILPMSVEELARWIMFNYGSKLGNSADQVSCPEDSDREGR